jgi:hypothetical protein
MIEELTISLFCEHFLGIQEPFSVVVIECNFFLDLI